MFLRLMIITAFLVSFCPAYAEEPTNYCKDPQSWVEWNDLVEKYSDDEDIQILHALRIGLCAKIEQGSITFELANRIFHRAHQMVYRMKKSEQKRERQDL